MKNYYNSELQLMAPETGNKDIKIKLQYSKLGQRRVMTKWLDLTPECIKSLQVFLDTLQKNLKVK